MKKKLIEIFGWYGVGAIILAYALVSFGVIEAKSWIYQTLNASGALGIVVVSLIKKAFQPAALNMIWFLVATAALAKIIFIS